jgi:hypothetical protein
MASSYGLLWSTESPPRPHIMGIGWTHFSGHYICKILLHPPPPRTLQRIGLESDNKRCIRAKAAVARQRAWTRELQLQVFDQ